MHIRRHTRNERRKGRNLANLECRRFRPFPALFALDAIRRQVFAQRAVCSQDGPAEHSHTQREEYTSGGGEAVSLPADRSLLLVRDQWTGEAFPRGPPSHRDRRVKRLDVLESRLAAPVCRRMFSPRGPRQRRDAPIPESVSVVVTRVRLRKVGATCRRHSRRRPVADAFVH